MFRKTSLSIFLLGVGGVLTVVGFVAYFQDNATLNLAGFFYGIPVLLGGLALKAAELEPVPYGCETPPAVVKLREQQATSTQNQIRSDVTRYRYGQEAHLEDALERLGLSPSDGERPELVSVREIEVEGRYALVLVFDSPLISLSDWQEKQPKIERFFGPHVEAAIAEPSEHQIELTLMAVPESPQPATTPDPAPN
ncbi:DUF2854 domain-containing protein [Leptolyngbya sp. PCC 6406]|uniref:DUF2854 domain-containing protein n=1 Tax=Leptolyngbya sp. PCC 6406 TaxID=1173264 RepID=UPI0002AC6302|nr:DUF2854 domain-containing protein [Leptolyngbya sp. PCC 6406]